MTLNRRGFTLIELLVVVAVLALLASIVFSNLGGAREGARISNALSFQSQTHSLLGSDLMGWWSLNEGSGTTANDTSGYDNHGTLTNFSGDYWVDGVPGTGNSALSFNGNDTHIRIPHNVHLNQAMGRTTVFTISAWINQNNWVNYGAVNKAGGGCWYNTTNGFWTYTDGLRCVMGHGNPSLCNPSGGGIMISHKPELNEWHHLICTADGINMRMYVNGEQKGSPASVSSITVERVDNEADLILGKRTAASGGAISGLLDDVRIYSRALTAQEIQTLYAQTKDKYLANE